MAPARRDGSSNAKSDGEDQRTVRAIIQQEGASMNTSGWKAAWQTNMWGWRDENMVEDEASSWQTEEVDAIYTRCGVALKVRDVLYFTSKTPIIIKNTPLELFLELHYYPKTTKKHINESFGCLFTTMNAH